MASFRSTTGTLVRASAAELNLLDDTTAATSTTVVAADRVVFNDDNVGMKQVGMTDLTTYFDGSTAANVYTPTAINGTGTYTGIPHASGDTVLVHVNGVLLASGDVTKIPASSSVQFSAITADDITILVISKLSTTEHISVRTYYPTAVAGSSVVYSSIAHESADKIFVYRNGILLDDGDVTHSSSASTVTFTAIANDEITIQIMGVLTTSGIAEYAPTVVAGTNQVYTGINHNTADIVNVFLNGVLLVAADYSTSPTNNTVTVTAVVGDVLKIQVIGAVASVNAIDTLTSHGGNIIPSTTTTYDLGSASKKWNNLYTADLHLSNEGAGGNSIDGTVGNWSIQEGNENLFLLNNSNGKKYKFKLEEVV